MGVEKRDRRGTMRTMGRGADGDAGMVVTREVDEDYGVMIVERTKRTVDYL